MLHKACMSVDYRRIKDLLVLGADVNGTDENGCTPLHLIAKNGCLQCLELLSSYGVDCNATDVDGWTPLFYAAKYGHPCVIQELIRLGSNVNACDNLGANI